MSGMAHLLLVTIVVFFSYFHFSQVKSVNKSKGETLCLWVEKNSLHKIFVFFHSFHSWGTEWIFFQNGPSCSLFFLVGNKYVWTTHTHIWWSKCMFVSGFSLSLNSLVDENVASPNRKKYEPPYTTVFLARNIWYEISEKIEKIWLGLFGWVPFLFCWFRCLYKNVFIVFFWIARYTDL